MNVPKLELMMMSSGTGCKKIRREINAKSTGIQMIDYEGRSVKVHAQRSVKYLGVRIRDDSSMGEELQQRVKGANVVHGRLSHK
eukprot:1870323-Pyramimonas_sp.AAC.1